MEDFQVTRKLLDKLLIGLHVCFEQGARAGEATEEVPEAEEDLEELNEEEIKKMQSDEVWILLSCSQLHCAHFHVPLPLEKPCGGLV